MTTVVQQSCVASGTISGSSVGCVSSAAVTEVNTVGSKCPCLQPASALLAFFDCDASRILDSCSSES